VAEFITSCDKLRRGQEKHCQSVAGTTAGRRGKVATATFSHVPLVVAKFTEKDGGLAGVPVGINGEVTVDSNFYGITPLYSSESPTVE
jgi:hypothetical protein